MKKAKQISIDILVDDDIDGTNLAEEIAKMLEERMFIVLGCSFQGDMTETYKKSYPDLMEEFKSEVLIVQKHEIKVILENGDFFYTKVSGTKEDIEKYYIGSVFNVGIVVDNMQKCVKVEFL